MKIKEGQQYVMFLTDYEVVNEKGFAFFKGDITELHRETPKLYYRVNSACGCGDEHILKEDLGSRFVILDSEEAESILLKRELIND